MSYTYLQEQGEVSSAECFSDIDQFVQSKLNLTAGKSCCSDSETGYFLGSQYGTMCERSTENRGVGLSMLSAEVSRARTLVSQAKGLDSKANAAGYGLKCVGSLARLDRKELLWKTHQCLLFGGGHELLQTLPAWGMWADGELWELSTPDCLTTVTDGGLLPTPTATDYKGGRSPEAAEAAGRGPKNGLRDYCRLILGWKRPVPESLERLMGWPVGWTGLKPLETDKYLAWQRLHSLY